MVELLKQGQYQPLPVVRKVLSIYAGTKGYIDKVPVSEVLRYERELYAFIVLVPLILAVQLPSIVNAINDCHAVLVSKIGACPRDELKAAGIEPVDEYAHEFIEQAALTWFGSYRARVASGEITHQSRGDASIRQGAFTAGAEAASAA